ncbi:MAG: GntR family transcriptional regulator [Steroidobacteraceae bacterium]
MFILNPQSGIPIYRQLVEQVRRMVASGQLAPGTELPSIREVAMEHAVNPMTISKAYTLLESEGLLERNRGKPMTVAAQKHNQSPLPQRLKQIEAQVEHLVLSAKQLQLSHKDLQALMKKHWEDEDV